MSAPAVPRLHVLRRAGVLALFAAAGAGMQTFHQSRTAAAAAHAGTPATASAPDGKQSARPPVPTRESLAALSPQDQIAALAAALPQMEIADLLPLVEHLLKARGAAAVLPPADPFGTPPPDLISPLLRALFTRWATLDAAGLMAYVESGPLRYDYDTRRLAVLALVEVRGLPALEELRAKSPSLARAAAEELLILQPETLDALLPLLKDMHPGTSLESGGGFEFWPIANALGTRGFLKYAATVGNDELLMIAVNHAINAELDVAEILPVGKALDTALEMVVAAKLTMDDTGALFRHAWEALPEGRAKQNLLDQYAESLTKENPEAAVAWARALSDRKQRSQALYAVGCQLPNDTPPSQATQLFAEAWLADPGSFAVGLPSDNPFLMNLFVGGSENVVRTRFREWHQASAQEAEAWLRTVSEPTLRADLTQVLLAAQPGASLALLTDTTLRLDYAADVLYNPNVTRIAGTMGDPLPLPDKPPPGIVPAELIPLARLRYLENNPPSLAEWETLTPAERRALSAAAIRESADPRPVDPFATEPESDDWLGLFNSLPPEERSLGAYYEAGAAYINSDEAAASQWLDSLPRGAERDAAATALVEHLVKPGDSQDGEAAFAWAAAMSGETERARYTAEAARAWAAEDPAAARAAVEASALPPAEKSALLQQLPAEGGAR